MARAVGRHVARRWYTGVGVRDVVLAGSAIAFSGAILVSTVVAEQYGPNLEGLAPTTLTAPTMTPSIPTSSAATTTAPTPTTAPVGLPGQPGPPGPPGLPGLPGATVTVPAPPTAPPTTVAVTTAPPTTRACHPPPSASHTKPTTSQRPCLPH